MNNQSLPPQNAVSPDEIAVRTLYHRLLESWNQREAGAMADLFTIEGSIIGFDGSQVLGQVEIAATMRQIFTEHQPHSYLGKIREVRFLTPGIALVRAVAGFVAPGQGDLDPALLAVQTLVASFQADLWRIELFQNTPAQLHGQPDQVQQLTAELRQLLGTGKG